MLVSQFDEVYSGIVQNEPRLFKFSLYFLIFRKFLFFHENKICYRWKDCLVSVSNVLSFAVGYAYVKEHFDEETKIMVIDFNIIL